MREAILGVAASTQVGHLIGSRSAIGAKRASHASALLSVVMGLLVMVVLIATKDVSFILRFEKILIILILYPDKVFGYMFSDDERVVSLVSRVMPLVASFQARSILLTVDSL